MQTLTLSCGVRVNGCGLAPHLWGQRFSDSSDDFTFSFSFWDASDIIRCIPFGSWHVLTLLMTFKTNSSWPIQHDESLNRLMFEFSPAEVIALVAFWVYRDIDGSISLGSWWLQDARPCPKPWERPWSWLRAWFQSRSTTTWCMEVAVIPVLQASCSETRSFPWLTASGHVIIPKAQRQVLLPYITVTCLLTCDLTLDISGWSCGGAGTYSTSTKCEASGFFHWNFPLPSRRSLAAGEP